MTKVAKSVVGAFTAMAMAAVASPMAARAGDLYVPSDWPALASDRSAGRVGDSLTVVIYETSTATNETQSSNKKAGRIGGQITAGTSLNEAAAVTGTGSLDSSGQTGRTGRMVAQISVVVDAVLPNGDLHVAGEQTLNVNGEQTHIKLRGRVRRADITATNTVLSSRLADVLIDYDGSGFVSKGGKRGVVGRLFHMLGL